VTLAGNQSQQVSILIGTGHPLCKIQTCSRLERGAACDLYSCVRPNFPGSSPQEAPRLRRIDTAVRIHLAGRRPSRVRVLILGEDHSHGHRYRNFVGRRRNAADSNPNGQPTVAACLGVSVEAFRSLSIPKASNRGDLYAPEGATF